MCIKASISLCHSFSRMFWLKLFPLILYFTSVFLIRCRNGLQFNSFVPYMSNVNSWHLNCDHWMAWTRGLGENTAHKWGKLKRNLDHFKAFLLGVAEWHIRKMQWTESTSRLDLISTPFYNNSGVRQRRGWYALPKCTIATAQYYEATFGMREETPKKNNSCYQV